MNTENDNQTAVLERTDITVPASAIAPLAQDQPASLQDLRDVIATVQAQRADEPEPKPKEATPEASARRLTLTRFAAGLACVAAMSGYLAGISHVSSNLGDELSHASSATTRTLPAEPQTIELSAPVDLAAIR